MIQLVAIDRMHRRIDSGVYVFLRINKIRIVCIRMQSYSIKYIEGREPDTNIEQYVEDYDFEPSLTHAITFSSNKGSWGNMFVS